MKLQTIADDPDILLFYCPGCKCDHFVRIRGVEPVWGWNQSMNAPTFHPSVRVRGQIVCHFFVRDGVFQFLGDCGHDLAGQSVPMQEYES